MRTHLVAAAAALAVLSGLYMVQPAPAAATPAVYTSGKADFGADLGAGGYDTVAYQSDSAAKPGKKDFVHQWNGATWQFSSAENLEKFKANPAGFAPQYGGYCAYAVSQGGTAPGDPKLWAVVGGKLYLNLNPDVQKTWDKDRTGYIAAAEKNWPKVLGN
jgi:YHS domain-containing protein